METIESVIETWGSAAQREVSDNELNLPGGALKDDT